jgi:hypothetical protein
MAADSTGPDEPDSDQRFHTRHLPWRPWPMAKALLGYESLSTIPLGAHLSGTGPSTRALGDYPLAAVPPCAWPCRLVS